MMSSNERSPRHPIRVVVERTGLKPELIRAWERRHGAIEPGRSAGQHRLYTEGDIERLKLLRDATGAGRAIGQVAHLSTEALARLVRELTGSSAAQDPFSTAPEEDNEPQDPRLRDCLEAARRLDSTEIGHLLEQTLVELGPRRTLSELVSPLTRTVGELWHRRRLRTMHEHLVTSAVRGFLEQLIERHRKPVPAPSIIVTTPAGQRHELGALLAAAAAVLDSWHVTFLGCDLPSEEIVAAVRETSASAVALSIVHPAGDPRLGKELLLLRRQLGPEMPILVGGEAVSSYGLYLDEVAAVRVGDLERLSLILTRLRSRIPELPEREDRQPRSVRAAASPSVAGRAPSWWPRSRREIFVSRQARERYRIDGRLLSPEGTLLVEDLQGVRELAARINAERGAAQRPEIAVGAAQLHAAGMLQEFYERLVAGYLAECGPTTLERALEHVHALHGRASVDEAVKGFFELFGANGHGPSSDRAPDLFALDTLAAERPALTLGKMWLLWLANHNPVLEPLRDLFDDRRLEAMTRYGPMVRSLRDFFAETPGYGPDGESLFELLWSPALFSPDSLKAQLEHMIKIEEKLARFHVDQLRFGLDVLREEEMPGFSGPPGPPPRVFSLTTEEARVPRPSESPWMAELVTVAKNAYVWLDQLSRLYSHDIHRLDQIPDAELDRLASWGMSGLWLVGLWQRSRSSERLKRAAGQEDAIASAYALHDYRVAETLGGPKALEDLRRRSAARGILLACDFVPNHMGIDSPWVAEHPEYFVSVDKSPFPSYTFTGEDLSSDPRCGVFLEDHYADQTDAAVVFRRVDYKTGEERFLYHGNDGTRLPWNDTAQLDYLRSEVRERMIDVLIDLARRFPVIRIDAAMTLVRQHVQRLWYPKPGQGGAIPSRAEHGLSQTEFDRLMPTEFWRQALERVAYEAPDTLLLAEGFWLLESYFVHQLGIHRVYNSAFMHLLRDEDNGKFRALVRAALKQDPRILERFANFLTTPDEEPAAKQLGKGEKFFALTTLLVTLPGLPLFGHGQVEGLAERYGMEYRRPRYTEAPDAELIARHEREIAPLLEKRRRFSDASSLRLFDVRPAGSPHDATSQPIPESQKVELQDVSPRNGHPQEVDSENGGPIVDDVIAYSNRSGGERTLVVVHNRQARRRVVLHQASCYRDRLGHLRTGETLGEALSLDPSVTYRFSDAVGDEDLVLRGKDLCEKGLELELGPYEYRVFVNIKPV